MRTIKAASVVLDFELYPRNNVDSHNVSAICDAMAAGIEIPPIIICRKTMRVVDGFHRVKAALKYAGAEATITVIEKAYHDDASLFADAMRYNNAHGARLDPCDRVHCVILGQRLGLTMSQIAGALNVPTVKLESLRADRTATSGKLTIALKRTVRHFAGRRLSKRQKEANEKLSGMRQVFYVNQLIELIESDMLDTDDSKMMNRLEHLVQLLERITIGHPCP